MRSAGQRGVTLAEMLVACFFAFIVLGLAGGFLLSNLRSYGEIKRTIGMQSSLKKSLQVMTRQISNAGGWLANPRSHFVAKPDRFTFAYYDVEARYCDAPDTLVASFYVGKSGLIEEHRCDKSPVSKRVLAVAPQGGSLDLGFTYLDVNGSVTADPKKIRAVRLKIDQRLPRKGATTSIVRTQTLQVELVNL